MVMPGMLPQLAIGLAEAPGFAAGLAVAALAHPAASRAIRAAAAIGARARPIGRRNRLSVGMLTSSRRRRLALLRL
jgi:hypothetical protein